MMCAKKANKAKTDADREGRKANQIKAGYDREEMLAKMKALQGKMDVAHEEMLAMLDIHHERMMACLGKTEATDLEANPEENESVTEHQKFLRNMPQWNLAERRISGIGSGI
jgi:hypothetical protein